MTRENKLALIVAFALILGVSVLLSDHLSSARNAEPGEIHETTRLPSVPERPIRTLDDAGRARRGGNGRGADLISETLAADGTIPDDPGPTVLADRDSGRSDTLLDTLLSGLSSAPGALGIEGGAPGGERARSNVSDTEAPFVLHQAVARTTPESGADADPHAPALTGPMQTHQVKSGESLYTIAARYYGNGNLWRDLARFNQDRIKPDGTVNAGVSLRIPSRQDLTRRPGEAPSTTPTRAAPTPPAANPPAPEQPRRESAPRTYTVARGDTLGAISQQTLGTSRRWREIYNLNKAKIPDPDNVRAGIVLTLPSS